MTHNKKEYVINYDEARKANYFHSVAAFNKDGAINAFNRDGAIVDRPASPYFDENDLDNFGAAIEREINKPTSASLIIPQLVGSAITPSETTFSVKIYEAILNAKIISSFADDIPTVELKARELQYGYRPLATGAVYSVYEMENARRHGGDIPTMKVTAMVQSVKNLMNDLAWYGDSNYNITGWLTNPLIESVPVSGADANARLWANKNDTSIFIDDILTVDRLVRKDCGFSETHPLTCLMDTATHAKISHTFYAGLASAGILASDMLLKLSPGLTVKVSDAITNKFQGGTNGFIIYEDDDTKFGQVLVKEPFLYPQQTINLTQKLIMDGAHGGTIVVQPKTHRFAYGI